MPALQLPEEPVSPPSMDWSAFDLLSPDIAQLKASLLTSSPKPHIELPPELFSNVFSSPDLQAFRDAPLPQPEPGAAARILDMAQEHMAAAAPAAPAPVDELPGGEPEPAPVDVLPGGEPEPDHLEQLVFPPEIVEHLDAAIALLQDEVEPPQLLHAAPPDLQGAAAQPPGAEALPPAPLPHMATLPPAAANFVPAQLTPHQLHFRQARQCHQDPFLVMVRQAAMQLDIAPPEDILSLDVSLQQFLYQLVHDHQSPLSPEYQQSLGLFLYPHSYYDLPSDPPNVRNAHDIFYAHMHPDRTVDDTDDGYILRERCLFCTRHCSLNLSQLTILEDPQYDEFFLLLAKQWHRAHKGCTNALCAQLKVKPAPPDLPQHTVEKFDLLRMALVDRLGGLRYLNSCCQLPITAHGQEAARQFRYFHEYTIGYFPTQTTQAAEIFAPPAPGEFGVAKLRVNSTPAQLIKPKCCHVCLETGDQFVVYKTCRHTLCVACSQMSQYLQPPSASCALCGLASDFIYVPESYRVGNVSLPGLELLSHHNYFRHLAIRAESRRHAGSRAQTFPMLYPLGQRNFIEFKPTDKAERERMALRHPEWFARRPLPLSQMLQPDQVLHWASSAFHCFQECLSVPMPPVPQQEARPTCRIITPCHRSFGSLA